MCDATPYNIKQIDEFNNFYFINKYTNTQIDYDKWVTCLTTDISKNVTNLNSISNQINSWKNENENDITAKELNKYSMTLYDADLKYTFSKIFYFIILAIVYIYFFNVIGIITPIMNLFNLVKTKITVDIPLAAEKAIQKMPNVSNKNMPKSPEIKTS
jgi:hypothetical protein